MRTHEFSTGGDHWSGSLGTTRQEDFGPTDRAQPTDADHAVGVSTEQDRPRERRLHTVYYAGQPLTFGAR